MEFNINKQCEKCDKFTITVADEEELETTIEVSTAGINAIREMFDDTLSLKENFGLSFDGFDGEGKKI